MSSAPDPRPALTLQGILGDERLRQAEYPVTRDRIYLAHAGVCPLPRRVADAITRYAAVSTTDDPETVLPASFLPETRTLAARLLGATPEEIALVGPTSLGLSTVATGLPFRRGDNVVAYLDDYPSNVYPWLALAERGVQVRLLPVRELGRVRPADVLGQVDESTRLVALASCHFLTGHRLDVAAVGRELRSRGIWFCLDAIQTLGAFPTTVEHVDFLAADAHKWLLGPTAAGLLFVRRELQEQLRPVLLGWHNVRCPDFIAQEQMVLRSDARRYEAGSHNLLGLVGLRAALELALEVGVDPIGAELERKRAWLVSALEARGCRVLNRAPAPGEAGGMVSFWREDVAAPVLQERLAAGGVVASQRADRTGRRYLRFSPHYYNTDAELERAVGLL